jgi:hypothetical protein
MHDDEVTALDLCVSYPPPPPPEPSELAMQALRTARLYQPLHGMTGGDVTTWINGSSTHGLQFDTHCRVESWW